MKGIAFERDDEMGMTRLTTNNGPILIVLLAVGQASPSASVTDLLGSISVTREPRDRSLVGEEAFAASRVKAEISI